MKRVGGAGSRRKGMEIGMIGMGKMGSNIDIVHRLLNGRYRLVSLRITPYRQ